MDNFYLYNYLKYFLQTFYINNNISKLNNNNNKSKDENYLQTKSW